jgi:hypothetical protein
MIPAFLLCAIPSPRAAARRGRQVAEVPVTLNYYVPIFLQLGGLKSGAAWSAAAGSYMRTDASYSVGFYRSGCTMAGCQEFRNSPTCPEYSW